MENIFQKFFMKFKYFFALINDINDINVLAQRFDSASIVKVHKSTYSESTFVEAKTVQTLISLILIVYEIEQKSSMITNIL
jgi:uncharacterized protein YerC